MAHYKLQASLSENFPPPSFKKHNLSNKDIGTFITNTESRGGKVMASEHWIGYYISCNRFFYTQKTAIITKGKMRQRA